MKDSVREAAAAGLLKGTVEQIEAAEAVARALKESNAPTIEWRRAMFATGRLCRRKVQLPPKERPVDLRLKKALAAEERARRAEASAQSLFAGVDPADVEAMRKKVMGGYEAYVDSLLHDMQLKSHGQGMTVKESRAIREKAKDRYHDLLKMFAGKQVDREPKKPSAGRRVLVREWPSEGFKG